MFHHPLAPDAKALAWLRSRGITEEVVKRAKIDAATVYMPQVEEDVYAIQFPYFRDGECINIKYRQTDAKNFRMYGGAERILYGHDDIAETTIIVEGEVDKLSLAVAGHWNAVSVPDGAPSPSTKEYSSKFDYLDAAKDKLDSVMWSSITVRMRPPAWPHAGLQWLPANRSTQHPRAQRASMWQLPIQRVTSNPSRTLIPLRLGLWTIATRVDRTV